MIPLHNHSEYSALDGYSTPVEIADRIEELGLPGAFLTDHGTVAGLVPFAEAMTWRNKKKGIKRDLYVGFGMEAYQAKHSRTDRERDGQKFRKGEDSYHLILLAQNEEGFRNLMRLSDEANRSGFYYDPRVDWDLLKKYNEGIIATSACYGSLVSEGVRNDDREPLDKMLDIFGERFYIELHTYPTESQRELNLAYASIATDRGIPVVYANDAHYARIENYYTHEALLAAQYTQWMDGPKKHSNYTSYEVIGECNHDDPSVNAVLELAFTKTDRNHPPCMYIMSEDEVRASLDYLPQSLVDEAIANSDLVASKCQVQLPETRLHLPKYKVPEETTAANMLAELLIEGLEKRYGVPVPEEVLTRAAYEFNALIDAGLQDYFLIVWDFINWAEDHGIIVGPGRGSAGGAVVAYALGITSIDPIKYGLQFERFWNPGRAKGLPDIDVDFAMYGRQTVIENVRAKYGEKRVLPIGNHVRMRPKSAIDKAGRALYEDPPYGVMTNIKKVIESTTDAGQQKPWEEMWETLQERADVKGEAHPLASAKKDYPQLFGLAEKLAGRISGWSQHASAVVISDVDLPDYLPCRSASDDSSKGDRVLVTQSEMHGVEDQGFPKFDFLGLRNMDTAIRAASLSGEFGDAKLLTDELDAMATSRDGKSVYVPNEQAVAALRSIIKHFRWDVNYNHMPESFWEPMDKGWSLGLFQITNAAIRLGKKIKPRTIEELAAIVALNRPGPLRDKGEDGRSTADRFVARSSGEEETVFAHPILEPILEKTFGDFLYQESVIDYFKAIGYDLGEADHIRKMLGKKLTEEMQAEFPRYMERAEMHMPTATAKAIWESIEEFSKYSFNKAHAIAYAVITAWCLYAKWKWPTEFIMASIQTDGDNVGAYIAEGRRMGVDISLPNINESGVFIEKVGSRILYGLRDIKGVGEAAAEWIIAHRPYTSHQDFLDSLEESAKAWKDEDKATRAPRSPKQVVPANMVKALYNGGAFETIGDPRSMSDEERAMFEDELLGVVLTDIYADIISDEENARRIAECGTPAEADIDEVESVRVVGYITGVVPTKTKPTNYRNPNADMAHITIGWQGETVRFAAFPEVWEKYKWMLKPRLLAEFTLKTGPRGAQLQKARKFT